MLSCSAAVGLVYSTLLMARVIKRFGPKCTMQLSGVAQGVALLALPRTQLAPFWVVVALNAALEMANVTCFTCTITAVNNVCARYPHKRGQINGVNVTVESAAKACGPALGGSLYAWTIARSMPSGWPNASVVYFSAFALLLAGFCAGTTALPSSIDRAASPEDEEGSGGQAAGHAASKIAFPSYSSKKLPGGVKMWWVPAALTAQRRGSRRSFKRLHSERSSELGEISEPSGVR